jgi:hypothetical protein
MQIWSGHQGCVEVAVSKSQAVRLILKPTLCNTVNFKCKLCIDSYEEHTSMSRQLIRFSQVIRFIATSWILNLEVFGFFFSISDESQMFCCMSHWKDSLYQAQHRRTLRQRPFCIAGNEFQLRCATSHQPHLNYKHF